MKSKQTERTMPNPATGMPTTIALLALASLAAISLLTACADKHSRLSARCSDGRVTRDFEIKPEGLVSDCATLLIIKDTLDESGNLNWSADSDISDWDNITIENNRVSELRLNVRPDLRPDDKPLMGEIPPELGNLPNLQGLHLGGNQLTGEIPPELGNLSNLQVLNLSDNQLTGAIPPELGNLANLWYLHLGDNQLTGEIPPELGNPAYLQGLDLRGNQLTGEIPPELGNPAELYELYLAGNQLTGEIPPELGNHAVLGMGLLSLHENRLTGCIPASLRVPLEDGTSTLDMERIELPFC